MGTMRQTWNRGLFLLRVFCVACVVALPSATPQSIDPPKQDCKPLGRLINIGGFRPIRTLPGARFSTTQKLFWVALRRLWARKKPLILVTPRNIAGIIRPPLHRGGLLSRSNCHSWLSDYILR
jgi:hypothetical protein